MNNGRLAIAIQLLKEVIEFCDNFTDEIEVAGLDELIEINNADSTAWAPIGAAIREFIEMVEGND